MGKKIVVLNGSPRRNGNTSALVKKFTEGAESAGNTVKEFFLDGMNIRRLLLQYRRSDKILEAAQLAPTAVNYQPQKIYILKSDQAVEKIRSICPSAYDAPVVFLIFADENLTWKHPKKHGYSTSEMDAS